MSTAVHSDAAPRFHSCPACLPVLDGGAECSWFSADHRVVSGSVPADGLHYGPGNRWSSYAWSADGDETVAGGSEPCDDVRSDELDEARGDAYDAIARMPLGTTARDAVDTIRARWELTDAECDLIVDRLCGA